MNGLPEEELAVALAELPLWAVVDGKLATQRTLPSFPDAIAFVQQVAVVAEELNHHPDIDIRWRTVTIAVCTHDAGDQITRFDVRLAEAIEAL